MDFEYSNLRIDHAGGLASNQTEIVPEQEYVRRIVAENPRAIDGLTVEQKSKPLKDYDSRKPYTYPAEIALMMHNKTIDQGRLNKLALESPLTYAFIRLQLAKLRSANPN